MEVKGAIFAKAGRIPSYVSDYPEDGHLAFLADVIKTYHYSAAHFAQLTGIGEQILFRIFTRNDIRIREVYAIAEALGMRIIWKFTELSDEL